MIVAAFAVAAEVRDVRQSARRAGPQARSPGELTVLDILPIDRVKSPVTLT